MGCVFCSSMQWTASAEKPACRWRRYAAMSNLQTSRQNCVPQEKTPPSRLRKWRGQSARRCSNRGNHGRIDQSGATKILPLHPPSLSSALKWGGAEGVGECPHHVPRREHRFHRVRTRPGNPWKSWKITTCFSSPGKSLKNRLFSWMSLKCPGISIYRPYFWINVNKKPARFCFAYSDRNISRVMALIMHIYIYFFTPGLVIFCF